MTKWQKRLVGFAIIWLASAEYLRFAQISRHHSVLLGLGEIGIAILTGAAFGVLTVAKR